MVPTASPMILLFAEIGRHRNEHQDSFIPTGQFLLGYLTVWTGFSVLATLTQWGLLTVALVSPAMESTSKALGVLLLLGAGFYQFSPLKYACLGPLPHSNGIFCDRMARRLMGRLEDGTEARRLLSRLLLGIDGSRSGCA